MWKKPVLFAIWATLRVITGRSEVINCSIFALSWCNSAKILSRDLPGAACIAIACLPPISPLATNICTAVSASTSRWVKNTGALKIFTTIPGWGLPCQVANRHFGDFNMQSAVLQKDKSKLTDAPYRRLARGSHLFPKRPVHSTKRKRLTGSALVQVLGRGSDSEISAIKVADSPSMEQMKNRALPRGSVPHMRR